MELITPSLHCCGFVLVLLAVSTARLQRNVLESTRSRAFDTSDVRYSPPSVWNETCPEVALPYLYTSLNGSIVWDEALCPGTCWLYCEFVVHVPEQYGLVVEFHHVHLWFKPGAKTVKVDSSSYNWYTSDKEIPKFQRSQGNDTLNVEHDLLRYDMVQWQKLDELLVDCLKSVGGCREHVVLRIIHGTNPVGPIWSGNKLRFRLYVSHKDTTVREGLSKINLTYYSEVRRGAWNPSDTFHHCSLNYPDIFSCNMIPQCRYSEDEISCEHKPAGCDYEMIPFRDQCFFFTILADIREREVPPPLKKVCVRSDSTLPGLLYPSIRNFVLDKAFALGENWIILGVERFSKYSTHLSHLYRFLWWWKSYEIMVYDPSLKQYEHLDHKCAGLHVTPSGNISMRSLSCQEYVSTFMVICQKYNPTRIETFRKKKLVLSSAAVLPGKFSTKSCKGGFHVQHFHSCVHFSSDAMQLSYMGLPSFLCDNGLLVHYTLMCDGHNDCIDKSDEKNCDSVMQWINGSPLDGKFFSCKNSLEMIDFDKRCDGKLDCMDGSDEDACTKCSDFDEDLEYYGVCMSRSCVDQAEKTHTECTNSVLFDYCLQLPVLQNLTPWRVELDGCGGSYLVPLNGSEECPETHVRCPDAYCIPSYMLNNGVYDCPFLDTDDEFVADNFSCPGFYRCYRSDICVHNHYLCDGVYHCPLKDDERYCDVNKTCPINCTCEGRAMTCSEMIDPLHHFHVRYLDVSGSYQPRLDNVHFIGFLQVLNLSDCSLLNLTLTRMDHLKVLDVSRNQFNTLDSVILNKMVALRHLDLSHNFQLLTQGLPKAFLDSMGHNLQVLLLRRTGLTYIESYLFENKGTLQQLDVSHNDIVRIDRASFSGLDKLEMLKAESILLCCIYSFSFPHSKADCEAPKNELSSCSNLLGSHFFRVCLWLLSLLALLGNGGVLIYRLFFEVRGTSTGFRVLVANLCVSDFTMGVYLLMIGSADLLFSGQYLWRQWDWTHSASCKTAGFLAVLSSEVSAFIICLITLDRLLVLSFPMRHSLHLTRKSAMLACGAAWGAGVALAAVPLLPFTADWEFYSQTGICIPLPITRQQFPGRRYAFALFIIVNFVLFLIIGAGQLSIYRAIHNTPMAGRTQRRQQDMAIARRLFLIVFTDFCCWFPVGVMGLLAARGTPIPGEVNVWTAIFVLPLNSALNPFLYTLNTVLERRRKERQQQRSQTLITSLQTDLSLWPAERVDQLVQNMVKARRLNIGTWPADQAVELFRTFNPETLSAEQVMEIFRTFNPETWSPDQILGHFRNINLETWSDEQVLEILRVWPADHVKKLVHKLNSLVEQEQQQ